jgi:hypothetical protein
MNMLSAPCIVAGLLFLAVYCALHVKSTARRRPTGTFRARLRTTDISFLAQSPLGFIGRLTRTVPAPKVYPYMQDGTNPVASFGLAVMATTTNTVRNDAGWRQRAGTSIFGVSVGNFPFQQQSTTNYGAASIGGVTAAPSTGVLDVNKSGSQLVYCNSAQAPTANLTSPVYVWAAASSGVHIQGGFETAVSATTNTFGPIRQRLLQRPG